MRCAPIYGGITDPRKAWLTLREVNEHATASKRQCLETAQHGLKQDRLIEGVSSRTDVDMLSEGPLIYDEI